MKRVAKGLFALFWAFCAGTGAAAAQSWPSRNIEMIIPFAPGGGVDAIGRAMAEAMTESLGRQIVVINRDGAAGTIGFAALASASADGYTLGFGPTTPITGAPHLMRGIRYGVDSFDYICQVFENVFALAAPPGSNIKSAAELLEAARSSPEPLTYGHAGNGSVPHLSVEHLASSLGLRVAAVAYRGDGQMLPSLLRGDMDFGAPAVSSIVGREFPVLAVFSDSRHPAFPDAPTVQEIGLQGEVPPPGLNGIYAPRGLPQEVQARLREACRTAAESPAVRAAMTNTGQLPRYLDGPDFARRAAADDAFKARLIQGMGLRAD